MKNKFKQKRCARRGTVSFFGSSGGKEKGKEKKAKVKSEKNPLGKKEGKGDRHVAPNKKKQSSTKLNAELALAREVTPKSFSPPFFFSCSSVKKQR